MRKQFSISGRLQDHCFTPAVRFGDVDPERWRRLEMRRKNRAGERTK